MSWLHTWSGLLLGWLLYAVFFTGTLSFFRDEINDWMRPELHRSVANSETAQLGLDALQKLAPNATTWTLSLPSARQTSLGASWREPGAAAGRAGISRATLDAGTGERIEHRDTRGGNFLYRFHFELYAMPRIWGRWIVGFATMLMFVAIISGVITHKKIFSDFFTFRPGKGQRSWLDAHNATAVLALPFHVLITFSGLLLLMNMLMPWGIQAAYNGDTAAYFSEMRGNRQVVGARQGGGRAKVEPGQYIPLIAVAPLMAQAQQQWPRHSVGTITVNAPGTSRAVIELREGGGNSLIDRGASATLRFNAVTGEAIQPPQAPPVSWPRATNNVFSSLHLGRFAEPAVRWLLFLSGVVGTLMAATGMVLWIAKRQPERRKLGYTPRGHRLVEILNVGTIAGLSVATAAFFWCNRLIPAGLVGRDEWEIRAFFGVWLLCLIHALLRAPRQAWQEQMAVATLLFALLPVLNPLTGGAAISQSIANAQWSVAGFDLMMLALAVIHGAIAWRLMKRQAVAKPITQGMADNNRTNLRASNTSNAAAASAVLEQTP